jgi:hypothetical protein
MKLKFSSEQADFLNDELKLNIKTDKYYELNKDDIRKYLIIVWIQKYLKLRKQKKTPMVF